MPQRCRLCLENVADEKDSVHLSADNSTLNGMIHQCIPEMDIELIPGSVVCKFCHRQLTSAYAFRIKCTTAETAIKDYLSTGSCIDEGVLDRVSKWHNERTQIIEVSSSDDEDDVMFLKKTDLTENDIIDNVNSVISRILEKRKIDDDMLDDTSDKEEDAQRVPPIKIRIPNAEKMDMSIYVCDLCPKKCVTKTAIYEHYQMHWKRRKRVNNREALVTPPPSEEEATENAWCYCRKKDDGSMMINCDNKHCNIKWFHMRCTLPKKWFCNMCVQG